MPVGWVATSTRVRRSLGGLPFRLSGSQKAPEFEIGPIRGLISVADALALLNKDHELPLAT